MSDNVFSSLQKALSNKTEIAIIYNGGSFPGTIRDIIPLEFQGDRMTARCITTNTVKTFLLGNVELPEPNKKYKTLRKAIIEQEKENNALCSIGDIVEKYKDELSRVGLMIQYDQNKYLGLFKTRKNGSSLKYPEIQMTYEENTAGILYNPDTEELENYNERKRTRPWIVGAKHGNTKTFAHLQSALQYFLELIGSYNK